MEVLTSSLVTQWCVSLVGCCSSAVPLNQLHSPKQSDSELSMHFLIVSKLLVISAGMQKSSSGMSSFPVVQAHPSVSQVGEVICFKQLAPVDSNSAIETGWQYLLENIGPVKSESVLVASSVGITAAD